MAQPVIKACAACKHMRRKCSEECVFAPHFPPDNMRKFQILHNVYGASNVSKLLNELSAIDSDDAVTSLVFEAECRLRNPVYGCVAHIAMLQQTIRDVRNLLINANQELALYIRPQEAMLPILQPLDFMGQQQPLGRIPQDQGPLAMGMIPQPQGPLGMIPEQQGPSGMLSQQQGPSGRVPQQQGPSGMIGHEHQVIMIPEEQHRGNPSTPNFAYNIPRLGIPEQLGPPGMLSQQQVPSGTVPQQQGLSGMIGQERQVIMIPEEQQIDNPSTPMFAHNFPLLGMDAPAMTSHDSQLMIHGAQQSLQQEEDEELQQRVFESQQQQLTAAIEPREQLIMMHYEQHKKMKLEFWRLNSKFYNMRSGSGDGFNDDNPNLQPEQQPHSGPHHQYFAQELDQHHSPDPILQFQPQQPEQHPPIDSCCVLLQQEPMALDTYNDNPYQFQAQEPELQPPSDPHHHFFEQDPVQHHFLDPIHQKPEQHHFPDASHNFLPQESDIHPLRDSNFQFQSQQPQQHHHPDPDPYHQFLPQHQHRPHPHDLQTELFFQPPEYQPLQQIPQLQQPQQQQEESSEDSNDYPP